jgi:hypothetical protein
MSKGYTGERQALLSAADGTVIEKLAAPNWKYDHDAAGWNEFVPELEALYGRIEFLKP